MKIIHFINDNNYQWFLKVCNFTWSSKKKKTQKIIYCDRSQNSSFIGGVLEHKEKF